MARSLLKSRILEALGSTTLLASVVIPAACGGDVEGGEGGTSAGGTSSGGSSSGGSSALGGTSGAGTSGAGTGGEPNGGAGGVFDAAADVLQENCFDSGVGVCCTNPSCMSPEAAWQLVGDAGFAIDAGVDGGDAASSACPDAASMPNGLCYWYGGGTFENGQCCYAYTSGSCCGRPFVIDGQPRLAGVVERGDWLNGSAMTASDLDPDTRAALACEWLDDARLEHASVASFARFVLELLALGAPAKLVQLAQQALGDEIDHARRCFSLASRYAQNPLGPAALEVDGALAELGLANAAARAVHEGCVGETLAARQAEEQLDRARDPAVRSTLEVIARDEAAHSELAWRFVRWAIASGGEPVRAAVRGAFEVALRRTLTQSPERDAPLARVDHAAMQAHGRLSPDARFACHAAAAREIIAPCARVLLDGPRLELEAAAVLAAEA